MYKGYVFNATDGTAYPCGTLTNADGDVAAVDLTEYPNLFYPYLGVGADATTGEMTFGLDNMRFDTPICVTESDLIYDSAATYHFAFVKADKTVATFTHSGANVLDLNDQTR